MGSHVPVWDLRRLKHILLLTARRSTCETIRQESQDRSAPVWMNMPGASYDMCTTAFSEILTKATLVKSTVMTCRSRGIPSDQVVDMLKLLPSSFGSVPVLKTLLGK